MIATASAPIGFAAIAAVKAFTAAVARVMTVYSLNAAITAATDVANDSTSIWCFEIQSPTACSAGTK